MRPDEVSAWLRSRPPLDQVRQAYPAEWESVRRAVATLSGCPDEAAVKARVAELVRPPQDAPDRRRPASETLSAQIRQYLTVQVLDRAYLSAATGVTSGRARLGLVGGTLAQRLLFARDLDRKPVSLQWFRVLWPLVRSRRMLMPLVRPKGIYCFYSRPLVRALAELIGERGCLEIGAGDGTLSRFLTGAGVTVTATDDYSWQDSVDYPDTVLRMPAGKALRTYRPEVVVCSWPPAGNTFERRVFATPSVRLYLVIGTRRELSAGNWDDYRAQTGFDLVEDRRLSRLVLPPELDPAVLIFRRRQAGRQVPAGTAPGT